MISISLCMIVKNESKVIGRCLDSVKDIADEIIIVDTGSTDNTKSIIKRYTDNIVDFEWIDDFSTARNVSFSHATMEYILWLDADDVLLKPDQQKFLELKHTLTPTVEVVSMPYHLSFDADGHVISTVRRNRLVRRDKMFRWHGAVHEYLAVNGCIVNSDIAISHLTLEHDSNRNLRMYERRIAAGETFTPRDLFYYANECFDHQRYKRAIKYYRKFLHSKEGWVEDHIAACGKLADCYDQLGDYEREQKYALKSFEYDTPRAEFCCRLGYGRMKKGEWEKAIFWYKLATQIEKPKESWGFFSEICWTWLPHIQLCVCYDRLGQYHLAYEHNEMARKYRPNDEQILHNKRYLESMINQ